MAAPIKLLYCFSENIYFIMPIKFINNAYFLRTFHSPTKILCNTRVNADTFVAEKKEFRQLDLKKPQDNVELVKKKDFTFRYPRFYRGKAARFLQMPVNQDWTSVWPAASTFKWSVVPLPVRQGYIKVKSEGKGDGLPLEKYANTELIKIPNFLHLTPRHITKHCEAIKKFCTPWPEELQTEKDIKYHFPVEVITSDYCFSGPSVRDPRARVVTMKFKLEDLELDYHAKDKIVRLLGQRFDKETGEVTLVADRCPMKKQNLDYLQYLVTALFFESWKTEPWEADKTEADMERYFWEISSSKKNLVKILKEYKECDKKLGESNVSKQIPYFPGDITEDTVISLGPVVEYKTAVEELHNIGENITTLNNYRKSVMKLLNVTTKTLMS